LNANVSYNFEYGTGNLSSKEIYGSFDSKDVVRICINETVDTYRIGYGELDYQVGGFSERRFYLYEDQLLSNSTTREYTLYNLINADSTSFIFEIKNTFLNPYTGKYLGLLRWYPDLDEYKVVEMAKTDEDGKTVMKVKVEDVDYRVGVYEVNGSLIRLADPVRMACLVNPCTYTLKIVQDEEDYFSENDIESSLTFDTPNNRFVYIWNDPNQGTSSMRLEVYKDVGYQQILICNDSASGYTGVLTCGISNYTGNFYAQAYRTAFPENVFATLYYTLRTGIESTFGLFAAFIFAIFAGLIGIFSPIGAIVMLLIGLIPVVIFGTINVAIFMGIVVLGGIIIHFLMKQK